jgi:class 3 adenylate cyclase/tetratricopeptide (TPR) repeat protein
MTEERKLVTVLFADIVGSTAIGASHDPEVVRRTLSRAFAEVRQALEIHGGTVEKFIGDAVMAVFGIPVTHDDDADRAVRAAFAVRDRIAVANRDGRFALELRIGVNSGQVVTGDTGETLVTGDAVNAGARLQAAAAPGEILVGALTHQLTQGGVRYGAEREIDAKGIGRLAVWPATELASALPAQHRGIAGLRAPLIGRDDELRMLVDVHRKLATERRAALVTVFGNAGVGKSRLVAEFVEAIGPDRVRRGRCLPYGEGITFWPVLEVLRADAGIDALDTQQDASRKIRSAVLTAFGEASDDADAVARRLSVLAGTATREEALPDVAAESAPQELVWGLRRYLERRAADGPLTIVFDDIHWAEPALLDLIEHLAEWSRAPLFLVCMARPDLREMRAGWGGGLMNASAVRLEPLTPDESARLIRELLAIDDLPDDLRAQVIARSEGNPLYVEEFLRMLIEAGHVARRDGRFVAMASLATLAVPATLQGLIAARLDGLPVAVKQVLQRGAVVGKVFWPEAIAALGLTDGRIEDLLLEAARRDLVSELDDRGLGGGRAWTFKHILIRDIAYDAIPKAERSRAHDEFGRWLERTAGQRVDEYADIVGYHAEQAFLLAQELGEPDLQTLGMRAYRGLVASGARAKQRGDIRASRRFCERALAVAEAIELPPVDLLSTRAELSIARFRLGAATDGVDELAALASDLRAQRPTAVLVELLQTASVALSDRDAAAAAALDREAIDVARALGDPETIAFAMIRSHWIPWAAGDLEAQSRVLADGYAYIETSGARGALGMALGWLGGNAWQRGAFRDMAAYARRHHEWAAANGSAIQRGAAAIGLVRAALLRGDFAAGLTAARESLAFVTDSGIPQRIGTGSWDLADALAANGDLPGARAALESGIQTLAGTTLQGFRSETRTRLARILVQLGDLDEARRQAELGRAEVGPDDIYTIATAAWALATVCAAERRTDEAERLYREARERIGTTGYRLMAMEIQRSYATFLIDTRRAAEAQPLLNEVRAFFDTPETAFERDRTDALLQRCAAVKR